VFIDKNAQSLRVCARRSSHHIGRSWSISSCQLLAVQVSPAHVNQQIECAGNRPDGCCSAWYTQSATISWLQRGSWCWPSRDCTVFPEVCHIPQEIYGSLLFLTKYVLLWRRLPTIPFNHDRHSWQDSLSVVQRQQNRHRDSRPT